MPKTKTKKPFTNIPSTSYIKKWRQGPHTPAGVQDDLIKLGFNKSLWSTFMSYDIAIGQYFYTITSDLIDLGGKGNDEFDFSNANVGRCLLSQFEAQDGSEVWSCAKRGPYAEVLKWFKAKLKK